MKTAITIFLTVIIFIHNGILYAQSGYSESGILNDEQEYTIKGAVIDKETNEALCYATVSVLNPNDNS